MSQVEVKWLTQNETINTTFDDKSPSIACDNAGNTYVAYYSEGGTASGGTNTGASYDIIVFKLDSSGNRVWLKQNETINTTSNDFSPSIACDNAGNTYIAYHSEGTASGGTHIGTGSDIIVFKLDSSGNRVWLKQNETINTTSNDFFPSIACDNDENTSVAYYSQGGTASGGTNIGASYDIIAFKLDSSGNRVWLKQNETINTTSNDFSPSIACDNAGNTCLAYVSDGGTASGGTNTGASYDIIAFKLDSSGNRVWLKQDATINTTSNDFSPSIACDATGNTYVSYYSDGGTASGGTNTGASYDIIVFKLDSSGNRVWLKQNETINTSQSDESPRIACDASGNTYVAYYSDGTASGGTHIGTSDDIIVFKLDSSGNRVWLKQDATINTTSEDLYPSIACDNDGNCYVSYSSGGTASGGTHIGTGYDIVVFKLGPTAEPEPTPPEIVITPPKLTWIRQFPELNTADDESAPALVTDNWSGATYIAYTTAGTISGGDGTAIVVAKVSAAGQVVWTRQRTFHSMGQVSTPAIAINPYENALIIPDGGRIFIAFETTGTVSGGETNAGNKDIAVYCLSTATGEMLWLRQWSAMNTASNEETPSIVCGSNGIYIAYSTADGGKDIVVVKLQTDDGEIEAGPLRNYFNTTSDDTVPKLAIDAEDNLYLAFTTAGTTSGDASAGGTTDIVVAKLDTLNNLVPQWIRQSLISSAGTDSDISISAADSNVYIASLTNGTVSGGAHTATIDLAVQCLTLTGDLSWTYQKSDINPYNASAQTPSIATDSTGSCYVSYATDNPISGGTYLGSGGDLAILKFNNQGVLLYSLQSPSFNTIQPESSPSIAVYDNLLKGGYCSIYVAYVTGGTVSGGQTAGQDDIALLRLDDMFIPPAPTGINNYFSQIAVDAAGYVYTLFYRDTTTPVICKATGDGSVVWRKDLTELNNATVYRALVDNSGNTYLLYSASGLLNIGYVQPESGLFTPLSEDMLN